MLQPNQYLSNCFNSRYGRRVLHSETRPQHSNLHHGQAVRKALFGRVTKETFSKSNRQKFHAPLYVMSWFQIKCVDFKCIYFCDMAFSLKKEYIVHPQHIWEIPSVFNSLWTIDFSWYFWEQKPILQNWNGSVMTQPDGVTAFTNWVNLTDFWIPGFLTLKDDYGRTLPNTNK